MATLEDILDEARKLPANEQRRLREALEELASNGKERPLLQTHERERVWIEAHRDEFLDQWVALDGDDLIAHGADARTVYEQARAKGSTSPYLIHIVPKVDAYVGGW